MSKRLVFLVIFIILVSAIAFYFYRDNKQEQQAIKIGLLHSLTGTMAISEKPLIDAAILAVEEINAKGGVLGRPIEAVIADGQSNNRVFAQQAERLITKQKVVALFGCWTSSCRQAIKPIVEKHQHLLFYPLQYEGLEQSSNIIYSGLSPSQQIIPTTNWALEHLGKRFYLLGSDYIFPYAANMMIKEFLAFRGGKVLAERYLPLGSQNLQEVMAEIKALKPDVIINSINGDSNVAFFKAFTAAGLTAKQLPILSLSIAEVELQSLKNTAVGHYAAWSYFQSLDSKRNQEFVAHFKQRFGAERVIDDPMESVYLSVYLWAQAAENAHSTDPEQVNQYVIRQSLNAPQGIISVDRFTRHLWRSIKIGQVQENQQFKIIWQSERTIHPEPFPLWHSQKEWLQKLNNLSLIGNKL